MGLSKLGIAVGNQRNLGIFQAEYGMSINLKLRNRLARGCDALGSGLRLNCKVVVSEQKLSLSYPSLVIIKQRMITLNHTEQVICVIG